MSERLIERWSAMPRTHVIALGEAVLLRRKDVVLRQR
jgi:hypothetical protein